MEIKNMYFFNETPLHVGAGNDVGVIDNPVQRDRTTDCPIIPGSSIKGVMRNEFSSHDFISWFGDPSNSGKLSFSEASLLLFPLRSWGNGYAMATSPFLLKKFFMRIKQNIELPVLKTGECIASEKIIIKDKRIILEEYSFEHKSENNEILNAIVEILISSIPSNLILDDLKNHIVILSDEDMFYFAKNACPIQQHVRIGENGVAENGALFNIEVVPAYTLFCGIVAGDESGVSDFAEKFAPPRIMQLGGNATTGLGLASVTIEK